MQTQTPNRILVQESGRIVYRHGQSLAEQFMYRVFYKILFLYFFLIPGDLSAFSGELHI